MQAPHSVKIWDIGIRVFHWALVLLLPLLWLLAEQGSAITDWANALQIDFDPILWHARLGYITIGLLVFRLLWGFLGSDTARFRVFLRSPKTVLHYVRSTLTAKPSAATSPEVGHNPAGGWMVAIMLLLLMAQTVSGLFNFDDVVFEAPFYALVSETVSEAMHEWHEINFNILLAAIVIHLNAIAFYKWIKRESLVPAMLNGSRLLTTEHEPMIVGGWRLLVCMAAGIACGGGLWWLT